jgi:hypothetical protein
MAMAATPLVFLMALMGGGGADLVSALSAKDYFEVRQIEPTVDKLIELASADPKTGKAQLAQLFALKHLSAEVAELKKSPKIGEYRSLLRQIADGKKAADTCGFAAEYAGRVLTALDGGKGTISPRGSWQDGAAWIPGHVTLLAGFDSKDQKVGESSTPDLSMILKNMPKQVKEMMFDELDKVGNVRVERLVAGMAPIGDDNAEMFVRLTGKANGKWLVDALGKFGEVTEKSVAGRNVRILLPRGEGEPALAFIDDSELLIGGLANTSVRKPRQGEAPEPKPNRTAQIEKMLALVGAGSASDNVMRGKLKDELAKVPAEARAIAVGTVPATMANGAPFPMPEKIFAHACRGPGGMDVRVKATMKGEGEAKQLVQTIAQGRDSTLKQIAQAKGNLPAGIDLTGVVSVLESIQIQSENASVQIQMLVPPNALSSMGMFGL